SSAHVCGRALRPARASRSTASGKESPSVNITKSKMLPFLPEEKSNHAIFWSLTKNEGVFSLLKGESPFHSRPDFLSFTRRPTTSDTGRRAPSSSRNWGGKRIAVTQVIRWIAQYRAAGALRGAARPCPGYPQGKVG